MRRVLVAAVAIMTGTALAGATVLAQSSHTSHGGRPPADGPQGGVRQNPMPHPHQHKAAVTRVPSQPGQDAFAAIAEIVAMLDDDPATDWNRVELERLRQHLVDMHEVVLRSAVTSWPVPGGLAMEVTGAGRTERAIRAMVVPHAAELDRAPAYVARTESIPGGIRLTVTVEQAADPRAVARLRGLGFAGLLTEGAHHRPHHLAMARGDRPPAH